MSGIAWVCLAGAVLAGDTTFQEKVTVPANLGYAVSFSPDKKVATVLFDNLMTTVSPVAQASKKAAASGPPADQTRASTKVATLHIPIETDKRSVSVTLDVRGFASAGNGATARLVICAGDRTQVVKLAKAKDVKLKGKLKEEMLARGRKIDGDFQDRVKFTFQVHAAKPVCPVTAFLVVEHDTDKSGQGGGLLVVDSIDLSFEGGTAEK